MTECVKHRLDAAARSVVELSPTLTNVLCDGFRLLNLLDDIMKTYLPWSEYSHVVSTRTAWGSRSDLFGLLESFRLMKGVPRQKMQNFERSLKAVVVLWWKCQYILHNHAPQLALALALVLALLLTTCQALQRRNRIL